MAAPTRAEAQRRGRPRSLLFYLLAVLAVSACVILAALAYLSLTIAHRPAPCDALDCGMMLALGATNETKLHLAETGPIACSVTPPAACYSYSFSIETSGGGITWNSIGLVVRNTDGSIAAVAGFAVWPTTGPAAASGTAIVTSAGPTESQWTTGTGGTLGGATLVLTTQLLTVYYQGTASISDPLRGTNLYALGSGGSFSGTVIVSIP